VAQYLATRFVSTLALTLVAMAVAVGFGLLAGFASAAWLCRADDDILMLGAVAGISVPVLWLGMMLQLVFAGAARPGAALRRALHPARRALQP
jgi:ABC-type dipeptide/oligopeptide/nickel transport system permease component